MALYYKSPFRTEERLILHLHKYSHGFSEWNGLPHLTQDGMSRSIAAPKLQVSELLKKLVFSGRIIATSAHVRGYKKRTTIYALTNTGMSILNGVIERSKNLVIPLIDIDGKVYNKSLFEIAKENNIHLLDGVMALSEGVIYKEQLFRTSYQLPLGTEPFYGRKEEFDKILSFLNDKCSRLLFITGLPGIGKSALTTKVAKELITQKKKIFIYTVKDVDNL